MSKMLIGESQVDLASAIEDYFVAQRWSVQVEREGLHVLEDLRLHTFDVIVLEIALPGLDGIGIVKHYRATGGSTPVVLITGRFSSDELQCGLDAGADSYLVKPFRMRDLHAQLRALMRRPALRSEKVLVSGVVRLDTQAGTVTRSDLPVHLRPMEFKLLRFLMRHPDQVFSVHALFERIWNKRSSVREDTVRTHVRTVRQKLDLRGRHSIITTVRGFGYRTDSH